MWAVVGLGNPGDRYSKTRHNLGAMVLDVLLRRSGVALKRHKTGCFVAETLWAVARVALARPASYMNESGRCVGALVRWYDLEPGRLIVVYDELDLPFASVRIKVGGGAAGHNGLRSVIQHVGDPGFVRVRAGISRPRAGADPVGWVLSNFSAAERKRLPEVIERAADAVESVVAAGAERAMNEVNMRTPPGEV